MKKTQKCMAILALVVPIVLGACGGSDSKSDSDTAQLIAADLDVSVSCGDWTQVEFFVEADCTTSIKNNSSASGFVMISWLWKSGDKNCGRGYANNFSEAEGKTIFIEIDANESGNLTKTQSMTCDLLGGGPVATDFKITVSE